MGRILTILSLSLAVLLFPPAVLAIISQNAIPGDSTYLVKRKLEDGILLFASITPTTKAWFSIERSSRRYKEATTLLSHGDVASNTLNELVDQTTIAAKQISQVQNVAKKQELINQLSNSIKQYDQGLSNIQPSAISPIATTPTNPPTPVPTIVPIATSTPTPTPTPTPSVSPSVTPSIIPTTAPTPQATPLPVTSSRPVNQEIDNTRKELEKVAKFLEEENKKLKQDKLKINNEAKDSKEARNSSKLQEKDKPTQNRK